MKQKFRNTSKVMEGLCFVTSMTGLNRPNIGKDDDDKVVKKEERCENTNTQHKL
jgi:hypothetical protein